MAVKLHNSAFEHAQALIKKGKFTRDERDDWSEHRPTAENENAFLEAHGWNEFAKWFLGEDHAEPPHTKARYKFPYGDFKKVHRCGVLTAESRAGQYKHFEIERAAAHLHGMIEAASTKKIA